MNISFYNKKMLYKPFCDLDAFILLLFENVREDYSLCYAGKGGTIKKYTTRGKYNNCVLAGRRFPSFYWVSINVVVKMLPLSMILYYKH